MAAPYPPTPLRQESDSPRSSRRLSGPWLSLPIQFFGGGAALGSILTFLLLFSSGETYDGLITMISAAFSGAALAALGMLIATILGLPLRVARPLRNWWQRRGWLVAIIFAIVGLCGLVLSLVFGSDVLVPSGGPGAPGGLARDPQPALFYGSTLLTALGLMHVLPSPRASRGRS